MLGNTDEFESPVIFFPDLSSGNGGDSGWRCPQWLCSQFCFFFFLKLYRSRKKRRAFIALGEVESESREFCLIEETFEMS